MSAAVAQAEPWRVSQADPRYDDKGPGTYVYPSNDFFVPGSFDLLKFEMHSDSRFVTFEVTFAAPITKPAHVRRSDARPMELENALYLQNIDIYLATGAQVGYLDAVPGRNVRFENNSAWDTLVILTPLPFQVRSALSEWGRGKKIVVPSDIASKGHTVTARIPVEVLGSAPSDRWAYQVLVTGATWDPSFDAVKRLVGAHHANAMTLRVVTVAEPWAFGGGELTTSHPHVIDLLDPPGRGQYGILRRYDPESGRLAEVPLVPVNPQVYLPTAPQPPPVLAVSTTHIEVRVKSLSGELVVLEKSSQEVKPYALGNVLDEGGQVVARVVMNSTHADFMVATAVQGQNQIRPGFLVRFDRPKE